MIPTGSPKSRNYQQRRRAKSWRDKRNPKAQVAQTTPKEIRDPAKITPEAVKATKDKITNEPLWQDGPYSGTYPVRRIYSENVDFSTFPLLCERVYSHLKAENPRVRREMPFAAFEHVMISMLNAVIIDHVQTVNAEDRYSNEARPLNLIPNTTYTPAPIMEYFQSISNTTTPQDDLVEINILEIAIPNGRISVVGDIPEQPAGGFGPCTAASYNIYECYVLPLVTSQLVMETLDQNEMNDFSAWDPLPDGMYPVNAVVNSNLFRYRPNVERLNAEDQQGLQDIVFPNGDNMHSRIRWSDKLAGLDEN